ncbi:MAG: DUF484 family protein [Gammaproteobacteria bacterium]|jgi:uncharacterized protein YigA (DUF484 family)|nr:DUF484 family protein [Gammaproteobacteria bacterium]
MAASNEPAETAQIDITELSDDTVREYLKNNSDFLQRNPDMLDYLQISHASGSAVSLVEKQVSVLRERNMDMRRRLNTLTGNARDNDKLYEQTRSLVLKLLEADSVAALCRTFMTSLGAGFDVEHASIILFGEGDSAGDYRLESQESAKIEIGALMKGQKPVCGALRKEELSYLFPDAGEVGSAALMPLGNGAELGLIAVGSSDAGRYSSNMGTLFLSHIADIIVRLLPRLAPGTPE